MFFYSKRVVCKIRHAIKSLTPSIPFPPLSNFLNENAYKFSYKNCRHSLEPPSLSPLYPFSSPLLLQDVFNEQVKL